MKRKESDLQISCVNWFKYQYPQYKMLLFAIPNGGLRNIKTAVTLKREGVVSGVPDLFLSLARGEWHGMYLELKSGSNDLTANQDMFFIMARKQGYKCEVIRTLDQFIREVTFYLNANLNKKPN
jgi:hypothetical protein